MKSGLLAAVAAAGLLLAGPASAQGVKIGILNDQSGVYADYGGKYSVEAAKMAVEDFGGSVLGQKIEVVSADHQNKPDLATAIARRWYEVEGVDMITELTTSSVALAIHDLSKQMKKIDIVVGAATSRLTGDACQPYGFHWAYDTHALAVGTGGALVAGRFEIQSLPAITRRRGIDQVLGNDFLVARRHFDDHHRVAVCVAEVHQPYLAIRLIEIEHARVRGSLVAVL